MLLYLTLIACVSLLQPSALAAKRDEPEENVTAGEVENATLDAEEEVTEKPSKVTTEALVAPTTEKPGRRRACSCGDGKCVCCSGAILQAFSIPFGQRLCAEIAYEPDDFTFDFKMNFNGRVIYKNKISGKNPRPICLPLSRYLPVDMCVKFSNVYMIGRNFHACVDMHGEFLETEIFDVSFDCMRIGTNGLAFVKPEEGGGLPITLPEKPVTQDKLDYDDSA